MAHTLHAYKQTHAHAPCHKDISSSLFSAGQRFPLNSRTFKSGGVHDSYTFPVQTGGIFYFPCHGHQIEGTDGF